jgi:hypothetical protein
MERQPLKTDTYTKAVLTVIAAALSVIAIQNTVAVATAQGSITKVAICNYTVTSDCAFVSSGLALRVGN